MTTYIGLLKGINVGGKNIIKMADLKQVLTKSGLSDVKTYIQSGNIIFNSNLEKNDLQNKIEAIIKKEFGFSVPVILRTKEEFKKIIEQNPFTEEEIMKAKAGSDFEVFYILLSSLDFPDGDIIKLKNSKTEKESFHINGKEIYFLFDETIRNSKMATIIQKSNSPYTIRNWKTINKLMDLTEPK